MLLRAEAMGGYGRAARVAATAALLAFASLAALFLAPTFSSGSTPHEPIFIDGDRAFVPTSGVTRGTGSPTDPFVIEGWEIDASSATGITVRNTRSSFVVRDIRVQGAGTYGNHGILLENVTNARIQNVSTTNVDLGITVSRSTDIAIDRSSVALSGSAGTVGDGIVLYLSVRVAVTATTVFGSAGDGIRLDSATQALIADNDISSNRGDGIALGGSSFVTVRGNALSANGEGIGLSTANNTSVVGNRVSYGAYGIEIFNSRDITVAGNVLSNNGVGVRVVTGSADVAVLRNEVSGNPYGGIEVAGASGVWIAGNNVSDNGGGPSINGVGVRLVESTGVRVDHNNFLGNTVQAADDRGTENAWDAGHPSGGNYWSDYGGSDNCSGPLQDICPGPDGIGDTPYPIDANSRDSYPLMATYVPANAPPAASFLFFPATGNTTTVFTVDASPSWDVEDPPSLLEFRWDWEDDGTWDTSWSTSGVAQHRYNLPGDYTIRLEVRDTDGLTNTTVKGVTVVSAPSQGPLPDPVLLGVAVSVPLGAAAVGVLVWLRRRRRTPP